MTNRLLTLGERSEGEGGFGMTEKNSSIPKKRLPVCMRGGSPGADAAGNCRTAGSLQSYRTGEWQLRKDELRS